MSHIRPLPPQLDLSAAVSLPAKVIYGVRSAGSCVKLQSRMERSEVPWSGGARSEIMEFSRQSRTRLFQTVSAIEWERMGVCLMVVLTYPGNEALDFIPRSGRVSKVHLAAFRRRWIRRWGVIRAAWKLEFQKRGAPHYHLFVVVDASVDVEQLRVWCAQAWFEVVGSGSVAHSLAGTSVDVWQGSPAVYAAKYARKGASESKEYQQVLPVDFESPGRWWGLWGVRPAWEFGELSAREFYQLRRWVNRWRASKSGYSVQRLSGRRGIVGIGGLESGVVAEMVAIWLAFVRGQESTEDRDSPVPTGNC